MQVVSLGTVLTLLILRTSVSFHTQCGTISNKLNHVITPNKSHRASHSATVLLVRRTKADNKISFDDNNKIFFGFLTREDIKNVIGPLSLLLLSQFILFIGVGAVIPSIPLYGKEIGLSSASNGIVISAPAITLLLTSKIGGNFADVARKPAMIIGMAIIALSDVGTAIATSIIPLVFARLGLGLGRCISEAGERGMLADLAGRVPDLRGSILAAQSVAVALGIAIGAPAGGYVVEEYGPRAAFLCVSVAAALCLCIYCFLPETIKQSTGTKNIDTTTSFIESIFISPSEAVKDDTSKESPVDDWADLLQQSRWKALSLCQCGATFGFAAKIAIIPILATSVLGNAATAGSLISACGLSGLIGGPVGGWLTDRTSAKSTAIGSGIISALSLILIPVSLNYSFDLYENVPAIPFISAESQGDQSLLFTILVIGWSLGATAQGPALTALAQESAPEGREATALALPRAAGDGTYIVAPFLLGLASDYYSANNYSGVECSFAGVAILFGVLALLFIDYDEKVRKNFS